MYSYILYSLEETILALILYRGVFHIELTKNRMKIAAFFASVILLSVIAYYLPYEQAFIVPGLLGTFGAALIYSGSSRLKMFLYAPLIIMSLGILGNVLLDVVTYVIHVPIRTVMSDNLMEMILDLVMIIAFSAVFLLKRRSHPYDKQDELNLSVGQYLLALLGEGASIFLCSFMQYVARNGANSSLTELLPFVSSLFSFLALLFILICLWQQTTSQRSVQLEREKEEYALFVKLQSDHYNEMMKKNDELRRFRHDYRSHMRVLNTYMHDGKTEDALAYLESISGSYESSETHVYTGILSLDSIIGDYENAAISGGISWSFDGRLPELPVKDCFALCTIFSNLLKNAVEACRMVNAGPYVETTISIIGNYISIIIRNSCLPDSTLSETSKDSPEDHGWGLKNVRRTAVNSNGCFEISIDDSVCTAAVLYQLDTNA